MRLATIHTADGPRAAVLHGLHYVDLHATDPSLPASARRLLELEETLVLAGDYNVIPEPEDCHDPAAWLGDALFQPESRMAFRALKNLGLYDAHELGGEQNEENQGPDHGQWWCRAEVARSYRMFVSRLRV